MNFRPELASVGFSGNCTYSGSTPPDAGPTAVSQPEQRDGGRNLLSDLPSLQRMTRRDQRTLERRLRELAREAKDAGAITVAAYLLRAAYELEKA